MAERPPFCQRAARVAVTAAIIVVVCVVFTVEGVAGDVRRSRARGPRGAAGRRKPSREVVWTNTTNGVRQTSLPWGVSP